MSDAPPTGEEVQGYVFTVTNTNPFAPSMTRVYVNPNPPTNSGDASGTDVMTLLQRHAGKRVRVIVEELE